mgnify:CR=1 FL=1
MIIIIVKIDYYALKLLFSLEQFLLDFYIIKLKKYRILNFFTKSLKIWDFKINSAINFALILKQLYNLIKEGAMK